MAAGCIHPIVPDQLLAFIDHHHHRQSITRVIPIPTIVPPSPIACAGHRHHHSSSSPIRPGSYRPSSSGSSPIPSLSPGIVISRHHHLNRHRHPSSPDHRCHPFCCHHSFVAWDSGSSSSFVDPPSVIVPDHQDINRIIYHRHHQSSFIAHPIAFIHYSSSPINHPSGSPFPPSPIAHRLIPSSPIPGPPSPISPSHRRPSLHRVSPPSARSLLESGTIVDHHSGSIFVGYHHRTSIPGQLSLSPSYQVTTYLGQSSTFFVIVIVILTISPDRPS